MPLHQHDRIYRAPVPIILATANGLSSGDKVVQQQIGELGEVAEPYILDSTPDVLSIGRRCVEDGYSFNWTPYSLHPTMTTPDGRVVKLTSRDCVPCLDDFEPSYSPAVPAVVIATSQRDEGKRLVTRDPKGPTYDDPKPLSNQGGRGALRRREFAAVRPGIDTNTSMLPQWGVVRRPDRLRHFLRTGRHQTLDQSRKTGP